MPLFHPSRDVTPGRDFPFMDMWRVAESLEFVADPERPVAVAARVADENIGHAAKLRSGTVQQRQGVFWLWFARYARPMRAGMSECRLRCKRTLDGRQIAARPVENDLPPTSTLRYSGNP